MSHAVTESEWLDGPPRRVVVKARRIENERKRLLALCAFVTRHRDYLSRPVLITAMELLEKVADGEAGEAHAARAKGLIRAADWAKEKLPPGIAEDLMLATRAAACEPGASTETRLPILKNTTLQADLIRDVYGNPFRPVAVDPSWRTEAVVSLARGMYESRDFAAMPVVAEALEDAGCAQPDILAHCRGPGPHVRGCLVVDLVLGKA